MESKQKLILALETGVGTGSMAVLDGQNVLISQRGGVTRAEDLLDTIGSAFRHLGIDASDLDTIAVSIGPGSYTGIRIGVATAMGIARGAQAALAGVPVLPALARSCPPDNIAAVVPIGRARIAVQKFTDAGFAGAPPPFALDLAALADEIRSNPSIKYVACCDLRDADALEGYDLPNLQFTDSDLADLVGRYSFQAATVLEPIYL